MVQEGTRRLVVMDSVKGAVKGVAKSLGAGDMDTRQLLTQGVNLGEASLQYLISILST